MNIQIFLQEINTSLFNRRMNDSQRKGIIVKLTEFGNHHITDTR